MAKNKILAARPYRGPVQAVILDWAGTAVDHGSRGPVAVFQEAFKRFGILATVEETRQPMGKGKQEHVAAMLDMPEIREQWRTKHGKDPDNSDVQAVFAAVQELMPKTLGQFAEPVPGCASAMRKLKEKGIAIGSCTGYSREMMPELIEKAAVAGFSPDCLVCSDEVPQGRPWPWMCWQNCMKLEIWPPEAVIKAGDTATDMKEGLSAGHWCVGVSRTGNFPGLTAEEAAAMDESSLAALEEEAAKKLYEAGAHFVISSVADLPELCDRVNSLLAQGKKPGDSK